MCWLHSLLFLFFFNDTATTEIYTLSLHDALPISNTTTWSRHSRRIEPISLSAYAFCRGERGDVGRSRMAMDRSLRMKIHGRSEEHTSELQSHLNLVCRLLLEKKKKTDDTITPLAP